MGPYTRYRLRAETGDELLLDLPTTEAKLMDGSSAWVHFNPEFILSYTRPSQGLTEALKLE